MKIASQGFLVSNDLIHTTINYLIRELSNQKENRKKGKKDINSKLYIYFVKPSI